jgi:hypothetical protein
MGIKKSTHMGLHVAEPQGYPKRVRKIQIFIKTMEI